MTYLLTTCEQCGYGLANVQYVSLEVIRNRDLEISAGGYDGWCQVRSAELMGWEERRVVAEITIEIAREERRGREGREGSLERCSIA